MAVLDRVRAVDVVAELQPVVPRARAVGRLLDGDEHQDGHAGLFGVAREGLHRGERREAVVDDARRLLVPRVRRVAPDEVVDGRHVRRRRGHGPERDREHAGQPEEYEEAPEREEEEGEADFIAEQ